jgi:hypothetical protein
MKNNKNYNIRRYKKDEEAMQIHLSRQQRRNFLPEGRRNNEFKNLILQEIKLAQ